MTDKTVIFNIYNCNLFINKLQYVFMVIFFYFYLNKNIKRIKRTINTSKIRVHKMNNTNTHVWFFVASYPTSQRFAYTF